MAKEDTTSRDQILALLRPGPQTVNELADALEMTDNGVRLHLGNLQAQGLVKLAGQRPGPRKPHQLFALTAAGHDHFPTADRPLLTHILAALEGTMSAKARTTFLRHVGRQMAESHRAEFQGASTEKRLKLALKILGEIGGIAEVQQAGGLTVIQGRHCPLANLVPSHPDVCAVAEGLLETLLDRPVKETCRKGAEPCCRFEVAA